MSSVQKVLSRIPLVIVLGPTGSGKTKLSLDIASKFAGEILSADAMQVYKGLDILTAKATKEEQAIAPHHLLDMYDPLLPFSVLEFRNRSLALIDDLLSQNKLPIVVGGTNYYIETILYQMSVPDTTSEVNKSSVTLKEFIETLKSKFEQTEPEVKRVRLDSECVLKDIDVPEVLIDDDEVASVEIHDCLKMVDPQMADRLHPNNRRKVIRSLQVAAQHKRPHSELLEEQHNMEGGSAVGGALRYPNTIIFWVKPNQDVLDDRLDKRVDKMIEDGLLQELEDFHDKYNKHRLELDKTPDYTTGIFQSIGFKEFHNYLILTPEERQSEQGAKLFTEGVTALKIVTRRYARKQNRWITNRLLSDHNRQVPPLYILDSSDVSQWDENVKKIALDIVEAYLENKTHQYERAKTLEVSLNEPVSTATTNRCESCDRIFVGKQFDIHMKSNRHKRILESKKKNKVVEK